MVCRDRLGTNMRRVEQKKQNESVLLTHVVELATVKDDLLSGREVHSGRDRAERKPRHSIAGVQRARMVAGLGLHVAPVAIWLRAARGQFKRDTAKCHPGHTWLALNERMWLRSSQHWWCCLAVVQSVKHRATGRRETTWLAELGKVLDAPWVRTTTHVFVARAGGVLARERCVWEKKAGVAAIHASQTCSADERGVRHCHVPRSRSSQVNSLCA